MIDQNIRAGNFNGLAGHYDRYRVGYSSELYAVLERFGIKRGAIVLDAGCGTGIVTEALTGRGMTLTGIDPSTEMLAAASASVPDATFIEGTVEALPFAGGSFDAAVCAQAFHWFDTDRAFAELMRVVKPGGSVAVWWKKLSSDDAMRALRAGACARVGLQPTPDSLTGGFSGFYRAPFADRALRVLPFSARFSIDDWIGYERSRATTRDSYGAAHGAYLDALRVELVEKYGAAPVRIDVRYSQYLYVGTTARA